MSAIIGPVALYSNLPIEAQFYQPSRFVISNIILGKTTVVTTSKDNNYVVGQLVRLLIPVPYGTTQLNGLEGYVISILDTDQVEIDIDSTNANIFIAFPFVYTITNIVSGSPSTKTILTTSNPFTGGGSVLIKNVIGMIELNDNIYTVLAASTTTITINVDITTFSPYISDGSATIYPIDGRVAQIIAIGDINSGQINSSVNMQAINVPGSFLNISPN